MNAVRRAEEEALWNARVKAGRESFGVAELAVIFDCSEAHFQRLIDLGELGVIDSSVKKSRRRVSRAQLIKFLVGRTINPPVREKQKLPTQKPKRKKTCSK